MVIGHRSFDICQLSFFWSEGYLNTTEHQGAK